MRNNIIAIDGNLVAEDRDLYRFSLCTRWKQEPRVNQLSPGSSLENLARSKGHSSHSQLELRQRQVFQETLLTLGSGKTVCLRRLVGWGWSPFADGHIFTSCQVWRNTFAKKGVGTFSKYVVALLVSKSTFPEVPVKKILRAISMSVYGII